MTKEFKKEWAKFRNQNIIAFIEQVITDNCSSFGVNKVKIVETISNAVIDETARKEEYLFSALEHKRELKILESKYRDMQKNLGFFYRQARHKEQKEKELRLKYIMLMKQHNELKKQLKNRK